MSHSLIIGRQVELFGGGQLIGAGPAQGAQIRLGAIGGSPFDLGAGEPQTTVITSLLLDGERPVGRRTGNATVTLPIYVLAPGVKPLIAAREMIFEIVDQETWELVLTLEGLPPTVFDCLRAKVTAPLILREMDQDILQFTVTAQRLPFGRSDEQLSIAIPAPAGTSGGGTVGVMPTLRICEFENLSGISVINGTIWNATGSPKYSGQACIYTFGQSLILSRVDLGTINLDGYKTVSFYVAVAGTVAVSRTFAITFVDNQNKLWHLPGATVTLPGGNKFIKVTMSLTKNAPSSGFRTYAIDHFQFSTIPAGIYLDCLVADGLSVNVVGGSRGGVYEIHDVAGSARAPINIDFDRPSGANITSGIVHRPKIVPPLYTPLVELNPATPLDDRLLTLPVPAGQSGAVTDRWNGTYDVVLSIAALVGQTADDRTTRLTIAMYHPAGGSDILQLSRTYTPGEIGATTRYLFLGRVTLPLRDLPADTPGAGWTLALFCGGTTSGLFDSFTDLMFIDTEGQTIVWQNTIAHSQVYVTEPDPVSVNHGMISNGTGRSTAVSISDSVTAMSGEPISLDPDENTMLVHCWDGATRMTITYSPRWRGLRPE